MQKHTSVGVRSSQTKYPCSQIRSIHKELGKVEHFLVVPYFLFNARFPHNPFHFNSSIPFFLRFCYPHRMFFSLTPGSCIVVLVYRLFFCSKFCFPNKLPQLPSRFLSVQNNFAFVSFAFYTNTDRNLIGSKCVQSLEEPIKIETFRSGKFTF